MFFAPDMRAGYRIVRTIAAGTGATVELADAGVHCVVLKTLMKNPPRISTFWEREVAAMRALAGRRGVVGLHKVVETETEVTLVLPHYRCGDLFDELARNGPMDQYRACQVAGRMASALATVAEAGYQHLDVKLENFCLDDGTDGSDGNKAVVLLDFGSVERVTDVCPRPCDRSVGTECYMPPEVSKQFVSARSDMWSLGVCLYVLIARQLPYRSRIRGGRRVPVYTDLPGAIQKLAVSDRVRELIRCLTVYKPSLRPTAREAEACLMAIRPPQSVSIPPGPRGPGPTASMI